MNLSLGDWDYIIGGECGLSFGIFRCTRVDSNAHYELGSAAVQFKHFTIA